MRDLVRLILAACLAIALTGAGAAVFLAPAHAKTWAPDPDPDANPVQNLDEFENRILVRVNKLRARANLKKVRVFESCVDGTSERWATHIKRTGKFEHRGNLKKVLNHCDLSWVGENLVRGSGLTPRQVVRLWMQSPSHKAVLMKKRARWAGIGVRVDGKGRLIAVLNFGDAS
jgi:uncharacterized protein YkwD